MPRTFLLHSRTFRARSLFIKSMLPNYLPFIVASSPGSVVTWKLSVAVVSLVSARIASRCVIVQEVAP